VDDTLLIPDVATDDYHKEMELLYGIYNYDISDPWTPHYENIQKFNWFKSCWCHM